jgi:small subunit ribosomal protein S9
MPEYVGTVGRRKEATARVRLTPGTGNFVVNEKPLSEYFTRERDLLAINQPLKLTETLGAFDVSVLVKGGGVTGQAEAVRHGIARALVIANPELKPVIKKAGLLTRDARAKERKKAGLKRARKAPQYTKR